MTGHLQIKKDKYYAVINTYENGKRTQKWISTGYTAKGNKHKAEKFLREQLAIYESQENNLNSDILFSEHIKVWLSKIIVSVDSVTYEGYEKLANTHIIPYFEEKKLYLRDITVNVLQEYIDTNKQ